MSDDLRDLYQQVILDHNRSPRNRGVLEAANRRAEGHNPLCGDRVTVYAAVEGDRIADLRFDGQGCAISTAAASLMTLALKGRTLEEARELFAEYHRMVTGTPGGPPPPDRLGKLAVFKGVCEFPMRVKCATLPWHTLLAALEGRGGTVSTEQNPS